MKRLSSILLWSVIAAAFIGPGTVTTAAASGAAHGPRLLWALMFSTLACLVLQEASGRLTVVTGRTLGQAMNDRFTGAVRGTLVLALILGAIVLGCAAYEAGNILGGVAGASLVSGWPREVLTLVSVLIALGLLWSQPPRSVARVLSLAVAVMGIAFLITAWRLEPASSELIRGLLWPEVPDASAGLLVLGLIGTTVVPYNLFLGSGLARGELLQDLRLGLLIAIGLGGAVSMGVLVVGTAVQGTFSFEALAQVLEHQLGGWARMLFGIGLFAAGLSSAITAPLAAAITARDLFGSAESSAGWGRRSWRYRSVWMGVLLAGLLFGLSDVRPIPVIILAQALNGLLLPLVSLFLLVAVNDRRALGEQVNGLPANLLMTLVTLVSLLLGLGALWRAGASAVGAAGPRTGELLLLTGVVATVLAYPVVRAIGQGRDAA